MDGIRTMEPLGYLEFLNLESTATVVLTDSGGLQEETTILGVPCLTLRHNTERPVTIDHGTNIMVGPDKTAHPRSIPPHHERRLETFRPSRVLGRPRRRANCSRYSRHSRLTFPRNSRFPTPVPAIFQRLTYGAPRALDTAAVVPRPARWAGASEGGKLGRLLRKPIAFDHEVDRRPGDALCIY